MAEKAKKVEPTREPTLQDTLDAMGHNERINFLELHAHGIKEEEYRAPLSEEEVDEVKSQTTLLACKMQEVEDKKKRFMDELNAEYKPMKEKFNEVVAEARSRERVSFGKVYYLPNIEEQVTYKVTEGNVIIGSRPIRREEMEGNIFTMTKS